MRIIKDNEELKSLIDKNNNIIIQDDITCDFNIDVEANINAWDINAWDINARDINARDINAWDINAWDINTRAIDALDINVGNINAGDIKARDINAGDISYYAVCFAYENIKCKSIQGRKSNCKHFVLDGKITIKEPLESE